ncbi:MAG: tetratricopeptide repeat protein [Planctomycetes bacterium]|nr:tetratricopeptide repeat protein [Planctomycetota bacterium]
MLALATITVGCVSDHPKTPDWHRTAALCAQAEERLDRGDDDGAAASAGEALSRARALDATELEGRARRVLGLVDDSIEELDEADALLAESADPEDAARRAWTKIAAARLALAAGRGSEVEARVEPALDTARSWDDPAGAGRIEAWARHLMAEGRRADGDLEGANESERQATLALTLLPETEERPLRLSVALRLGDDLAAVGSFDKAFAAHAQAAGLARALDDARAEASALGAQARDLVGLGRFEDAVSHAERAVGRALEAGADDLASELAREALPWMDRLGLPADGARRRPFERLAGDVR